MQVSSPDTPRFASLSALEGRLSASKALLAKQKQAVIDAKLQILDGELFSKVAITGIPSEVPDVSYRTLLSGIKDLINKHSWGFLRGPSITYRRLKGYFAKDPQAKQELKEAMRELRSNKLLKYGWFSKIRLTELGQAAVKKFKATPAPAAAPRTTP